MSDDKSRVTMLWPTNLKDQVREKVGARGLTDFAVEAVGQHLTKADRQGDLQKEVNELKNLAQLLADRVAMGGDYQDRRAALMEVELPPWIDTQGWPDDLAELVRPELLTLEEPVPAPVVEPVEPEPEKATTSTQDDEDEDLHRPMFMTGRPKEKAPEEPVEPVAPVEPRPLPHDAGGDDLLARVRAKALEKGVDLGDMPMKKASEIEPPARVDAPDTPDTPDLPAAPAEKVDVCPKCGSELVGGECWECF